jgi:hypothetical protein
LITSAPVGSHDANPTNTISPSFAFALSSLATASDEQYESIPYDEIVLLARKFWVMHKFQKERRRNSWNSRGCFECRDTTHFSTDCPKRMKWEYSNKKDHNNKNDNKNNYTKKNRFGDGNRRNIQKIMSWACATLSEDSSSSEEDEKINYKK